MHAQIGDRLLIWERYLGKRVRDGEIIEVHGPAGAPPYVVRWDDSGRPALVYPGRDAMVRHLADTVRATGE
ncbi:DUF1918 domain-containing protein [Phytoactinopolyspora halotolerans]|uniref:DUF1918 domain-containing protein n=1 Tax=Phytoactinopolyspora halotolerans TaxID=1981512 RepID=A0A6L9S6L2_9ACTN|nr:DUF1918 domain-containing protein [Phytoactinopolyspora halotolerans]NEE00657.1 DUF1918 domain-containing protein [Phytoactinopolyspora halotolerans]